MEPTSREALKGYVKGHEHIAYSTKLGYPPLARLVT